MKKITLSLFSIAIAFTTFAQDAKVILDKLAKTSETYETVKGDFEYKLENTEANVFESSKGTFLIKGDKYFVDILGTETYFDGKNLYSYIKDVEEVTIQMPEEDDKDFLKPSNLFTIYQKGYNYKYVGKVVEGGRSIYVIDLLPKNEDSNFKKMVIKVAEKTNRLVSMKSVGKSGDDVEIKITKMQENIAIDDSRFTFNEATHPDVEVVDMR